MENRPTAYFAPQSVTPWVDKKNDSSSVANHRLDYLDTPLGVFPNSFLNSGSFEHWKEGRQASRHPGSAIRMTHLAPGTTMSTRNITDTNKKAFVGNGNPVSHFLRKGAPILRCGFISRQISKEVESRKNTQSTEFHTVCGSSHRWLECKGCGSSGLAQRVGLGLTEVCLLAVYTSRRSAQPAGVAIPNFRPNAECLLSRFRVWWQLTKKYRKQCCTLQGRKNDFLTHRSVTTKTNTIAAFEGVFTSSFGGGEWFPRLLLCEDNFGESFRNCM